MRIDDLSTVFPIYLISIVFLLLGLFLAILIIEKGYSNPLIYAAFILYIPISQFLYTPLFKLTGGYTYYSPMLLGYMVNDQQIDLHSGTSFDHLLVLRKVKSGIELRNSPRLRESPPTDPRPVMKYTYEELAKMIDHSLLHPTMTDQELEDGCRLAARYGVASVCIKPYAVTRAAELLRARDLVRGINT